MSLVSHIYTGYPPNKQPRARTRAGFRTQKGNAGRSVHITFTKEQQMSKPMNTRSTKRVVEQAKAQIATAGVDLIVDAPLPVPEVSEMTLAEMGSLVRSLPTPELRAMVGVIMSELRARKAGEAALARDKAESVAAASKPAPKAKAKAPAVVEAAPIVTPSKADADKAAYLAKKAAYNARPYTLQCVATGKIMKRRIVDLADAQAQRDALAALMKREYVVIEVPAAE